MDRAQRLLTQGPGRRLPGEIDSGAAAAVEILEPNGVRPCVIKVEGRLEQRAALTCRFVRAFQDWLAVDVQAKSFRVLACVAIVDPNAKLIVPGSGWDEAARPAHRVVIPVQTRDRNRLVPVEIDVAIDTCDRGRTAQVDRREVLGRQAMAGTGHGMQRGVFYRHGHTVDQSRTLSIVNPGLRKAPFNAVERVYGRRRRSVVVALQGLHELSR